MHHVICTALTVTISRDLNLNSISSTLQCRTLSTCSLLHKWTHNEVIHPFPHFIFQTTSQISVKFIHFPGNQQYFEKMVNFLSHETDSDEILICVCPCIIVICGEEKPTSCHSMIYCSCEPLYMFRALTCSLSGAPRLYLDYNTRCVVPKLLVVGRQVQGSNLCVQRERATSLSLQVIWPVELPLSLSLSGHIACCPAPACRPPAI
jgi:hypothetical protein